MKLMPDDYGQYAMRANLSSNWKTPGEVICRHDFLESFSILLKFRATSRTSSFTLLNITTDGGTEFSIVVDLKGSALIVEFGEDCEVLESVLSFEPINVESSQWHRLALAVNPSHITLYQDCEKSNTFTFRRAQTCRITCDETVTVGVLEEIDGPGTVSVMTITVCYLLNMNYTCALCYRWRYHNSYTFQTMKPHRIMKQVLQCSAMPLTKTNVARLDKDTAITTCQLTGWQLL